MARTIDDSIDWDAYVEDANDGRADIKPASAFLDEVVRYFHGEDEVAAGTRTPWPSLGANLCFRPGEVTLWAGVNGHGKSGVQGFAMLDAMSQSQKVCIASMEMPPRETIQRLCRQAACGSAPSIEYIEKFHGWTDGRLWLYAHQGTVPRDRMIALSRYCRTEIGIDHMVIDSIMKCGIAPDDYAGQKNFVDALCVLARDTGMHIHVVHHMRKSERETDVPDKFGIKGAGEITDLVDNVLIVYRNKRKEAQLQSGKLSGDALEAAEAMADTLLICDKQRHFTWEGTTKLWFDKDTLQFLDQRSGGEKYLDLQSGQWQRAWRRK